MNIKIIDKYKVPLVVRNAIEEDLKEFGSYSQLFYSTAEKDFNLVKPQVSLRSEEWSNISNY